MTPLFLKLLPVPYNNNKIGKIGMFSDMYSNENEFSEGCMTRNDRFS